MSDKKGTERPLVSLIFYKRQHVEKNTYTYNINPSANLFRSEGGKEK